jgi:N utilization substance protein A
LNGDIATVVVPDKHLSLAIGKDGQNARLAAKLTGWRIDIKSASTAEAERVARLPPPEEKIEVVESTPAAPVAEVVAKAGEKIAPPVVKEEVLQPAAVIEPSEEELEEEPEVEEEAKVEPVEAQTVLSSTFIPRRIIQPRDGGKTQIRFAEDIFANRPGRSEDKHRNKKKKFNPNKAKGNDSENEG